MASPSAGQYVTPHSLQCRQHTRHRKWFGLATVIQNVITTVMPAVQFNKTVSLRTPYTVIPVSINRRYRKVFHDRRHHGGGVVATGTNVTPSTTKQ